MSTNVHDQSNDVHRVSAVKLSVRDAAQLLAVSTKTIYRWSAGGQIPSYRVSNSLRFDRAELLEWATANRVVPDPAVLREPVDASPIPPFDAALEAGGIHYRIEGHDRDGVLANVARALRIPDAERDLVYEALRAREQLASTGVGDGIALPHLRNPLRFHLDQPTVSLCFLERPVPWHTPDGSPVQVLFVVLGATVRAVLQLHSRTLFALRDPRLREAVLTEQSRDTLLTAARDVCARWNGARS